MSVYIKGHYIRSIYQNANGYNIGIFKVSDTDNEKLADYLNNTITFTGYFAELNDVDTYIFYGQLVNHEKYGEQFQVESYERSKPEEKDSIVEFLTSGQFKGIGEKKAKAIVDVLGKDTLKIILENKDSLILIPGITHKNIETLHSKLKEYEASYETIIYLQNIGFSNKDSMIIYNYYKNNTKKIIEENIYDLVKTISNLTFKKIDKIALSMNIDKLSPIRIKAAILYIMDEVSNLYGHCYYKKDELLTTLPKILSSSVDEELFDKIINELQLDLDVVVKEDKYYLTKMYEAETLIVKRFRLLANTPDLKKKNIDAKIKELEQILDINYNTDQLEAIKSSCLKSFLIITGGPGTGKTTIMRAIIELYRTVNKLSIESLLNKVALLAPTGRAAKRMSETSLLKASTIHRFLKWQKETNKFQVNEYNKSKVELVIIDEASMVDTYLMASLLKGLSANCKIILVGDDHQLPSVGPGQILRDLIKSGKLPIVELKELYRQGKDSNILSLAYDIRNKTLNKDVFNKDEDLTFIECDSNNILKNIMEVSNTYKDLSYKKFQILSPMYKTYIGIDNINDNIQKVFNPKSKNKKEIKVLDTIFREGDKVIQLTNMPEENVYNGDIGIIERITTSPKKEIYIDYDGNTVKYTPANFSNFRLAYSISIHKSQGSEFDVVIMPISRIYNKMLYQKLIYTGITRCKKKLYLIGEISSLDFAVKNKKDDIRRTTIKDFLINGIK